MEVYRDLYPHFGDAVFGEQSENPLPVCNSGIIAEHGTQSRGQTLIPRTV